MAHAVTSPADEIRTAAFLRSFGTNDPFLFSGKSCLNWGTAPNRETQISESCGLNPEDYEIRYEDGQRRALKRFDFTTEWNNLGFGSIEFGNSPFQIPALFRLPPSAQVIARIHHRISGEAICDYAALLPSNDGISLWFARPVGPVDGFDWSYVENFVSEFEIEKWGGAPVLSDLPAGFAGAFTMRIDCDEAIASGRPLFELYASMGIPFSMAIKTGQDLGANARGLIADVLSAGGSIVSHSQTHAPDWGVPQNRSDIEISEARKELQNLGLDGINLDFAVSPFHQNSVAAVQALREHHILGFVGGIACNDPEFLMARTGQVPFVPGIISVSQQCMLHGDCFHAQGSRLEIEKEAFRLALRNKSFFGYLDHPFSAYQYGWNDEAERLAAHREYLRFLLGHAKIWKPNLVEALRFARKKSQVRIKKTSATSWDWEQRPENGGDSPEVQLKMGDRVWVEE